MNEAKLSKTDGPADSRHGNANTPSLFSIRLAKLLHPSDWGLKARFLYVSGALLALGCLTLACIFLYYQSRILQESTESRLAIFEQWVQDKISTHLDLMSRDVTPLTTAPEVVEAMRTQNREKLKHFIVPYMERLRTTSGLESYYYHFHLPPAVSFLRTWELDDTGKDLSELRHMVVKANKYKAPFKGIEVGQGGAVLRSIVPITDDGQHLGSVEVALPIEALLARTPLPSGFGVTLVLDKRFAQVFAGSNQTYVPHGKWLTGKNLRLGEDAALYRALDGGDIPGRIGDTFFRFQPVEDFQGQPIGGILASYDASHVVRSMRQEALLFGLAFGTGAVVLWLVLYFNLVRVRLFLSRLRRILVATNAGNFTERFETAPVHCLNVLRCEKRDCPVHENPSLICYLETGSLAVSPELRDTCIFLGQYRRCEACPVYAMRHGDELTEMRNAVNTVVRVWGGFASKVNSVIAGVLHSREAAEHVPSLAHIRASLEYMAQLTAFTHDLQGVISKEEVYGMLDNVFRRQFGLFNYAVFEINPGDNRMEVAVNTFQDAAALCHEAFPDPDLCRAKRVVNEVCSHTNSALCPYFHIDHQAFVRCCLPMVMGGRVGGVISFIFPRSEWDKHRLAVAVIQKYLNECAPVLSTLHLLQVSKDNSLRDALTGVHNRRFLDEYIKKYEAIAVRDSKMIGFIMADVDFFKQVNDQLGHIAGDTVLKELGLLLLRTVRRADLVVRFGGEEFLILLHEVQDGYAVQVAEKIRLAVEGFDFVMADGRVIHKTISLGVSEFPADANLFYKAIKFADVALYRAKQTGRNKVVRFTHDMWEDAAY